MLQRSLVFIVFILAMGCGKGAPIPLQGTTTEHETLAFDPASAENTLQWLAQFGTEYLAAQGNETATETVQEKISLQFESLKGKEFAWVVTIGAIQNNGIYLKPICQPFSFDETIIYIKGNPKKQPPKNMFPASLLALNPVREDPESAEPFNLQPDAWVLKQRPGNSVRVTGNIARVFFTPMAENVRRYSWFRISVEDYQFKPVTE